MLIGDYKEYFENLCINHPELNHDDSPGNKVFELIDIEEAFGSLRSATSATGYIFRLIKYTSTIDDNFSADARKLLQCGFIVGKNYNNRGDSSDYLEALNKAEKIKDDFFVRMKYDAEKGHTLVWPYFRTLQEIRSEEKSETGDNTYAGWITFFMLKPGFDNCITSPTAPLWKDLI